MGCLHDEPLKMRSRGVHVTSVSDSTQDPKSVKITPSRINTLLTIGENLNIEFKRAGDGPKADTFESVCAFLNKAGGDLLLGVDDDGTVVGLPPKTDVLSVSAASVSVIGR